MTPTRRIVNRGFGVTLVILLLAGEFGLRALAGASPPVVRVVYGTTLAMYMQVHERLTTAAPEVRVLAMGDSLSLTQFQPDVFARATGRPDHAVFNASYLALTFRSQEHLLREIGMDRFRNLRRVLLFVNPRRLTTEGNIDADVFRVAIPDADGTWQEAWRERSVAPVLDRSRLYGLSRYLVSASWRQLGRETSWDAVEYLLPNGGVSFPGSRPAGTVPGYVYAPIGGIEDPYVADLQRVIALFRDRGVEVVLMPSITYPKAMQFANEDVSADFEQRMQRLARNTGSAWIPFDGSFRPLVDTDFIDYGHLNRSGGTAFTTYLATVLDALPPIAR